jgi:hypothetical protein
LICLAKWEWKVLKRTMGLVVAWSRALLASKSLAVECARLCLDKARSNGVKSEGKYRKRESEAKIKQRHYHVQDSSNVSFSEMSMKLTGFPAIKMTHSGLQSMYNIQAGPDLGMGKIAL